VQPEPPTAPFIFGADISWVPQQEDEGVRFSDQGVQQDIFTILKQHKFHWIRLRIFNNPKAEKGYSKKGYCDLPHTLQMAKRIKAAGMGFLLDFHYRDIIPPPPGIRQSWAAAVCQRGYARRLNPAPSRPASRTGA
jgi:arabinogalactan endo-1,4-beta-galactosidase